jgi:hypothetical protein
LAQVLLEVPQQDLTEAIQLLVHYLPQQVVEVVGHKVLVPQEVAVAAAAVQVTRLVAAVAAVLVVLEFLLLMQILVLVQEEKEHKEVLALGAQQMLLMMVLLVGWDFLVLVEAVVAVVIR